MIFLERIINNKIFSQNLNVKVAIKISKLRNIHCLVNKLHKNIFYGDLIIAS